MAGKIYRARLDSTTVRTSDIAGSCIAAAEHNQCALIEISVHTLQVQTRAQPSQCTSTGCLTALSLSLESLLFLSFSFDFLSPAPCRQQYGLVLDRCSRTAWITAQIAIAGVPTWGAAAAGCAAGASSEVDLTLASIENTTRSLTAVLALVPVEGSTHTDQPIFLSFRVYTYAQYQHLQQPDSRTVSTVQDPQRGHTGQDLYTHRVKHTAY